MPNACTGQVLHIASLGMATTSLLLTVGEADACILFRADLRYPPYHGAVRVIDARTGTLMRTGAARVPEQPRCRGQR